MFVTPEALFTALIILACIVLALLLAFTVGSWLGGRPRFKRKSYIPRPTRLSAIKPSWVRGRVGSSLKKRSS